MGVEKLSREQLRERTALLFLVIRAISAKNGWCYKVNIQKVFYMAQEMLRLTKYYKFERYIYGPYCFSLNETLSSAILRSYVYEDEEDVMEGDPPSYRLNDDVIEYLESIKNKGEMPAHLRKIEFAANWLGGKRAVELERLTAVYMVMREVQPDNRLHIEEQAREKIIAEVQLWKPHLSAGEIRDAIEVLLAKHQEAQELLAELNRSATATSPPAN